MLLHVVARGKIGRSPEADLIARYAKRIAWPIKLTELPDTGGTVPAPQPQSTSAAGSSLRKSSPPCSASGAMKACAKPGS